MLILADLIMLEIVFEIPGSSRPTKFFSLPNREISTDGLSWYGSQNSRSCSLRFEGSKLSNMRSRFRSMKSVDRPRYDH